MGDAMHEELRDFGSQLENLGQALSQKAPPGHQFVPPPRDGRSSRAVDDGAIALEVAKRSTWYTEPPPIIPEGVPLIEVQHGIVMKKIGRCPSRPRTAHPKLFMYEPTRPDSAPASSLRASLSPRLAATENASAADVDFGMRNQHKSQSVAEDTSLVNPEDLALEGDAACTDDVPELEGGVRIATGGVWQTIPGPLDELDMEADEDDECEVSWRIA